VTDPRWLPADLPVPEDDGAADGLEGRELPDVALPTTSGDRVGLREAAAGTLVLYVYPATGTAGVPMPRGWDDIPGARGCTPQNCAFRDHASELSDLGATVHGLSAQPLAEQRDFVRREPMPYPLLNDSELVLARELDLPTFEVVGRGRLYKRLTLVASGGRIEKVLYPVFPPGADAGEVIGWLRARLSS
jgi:peroxiredoxin